MGIGRDINRFFGRVGNGIQKFGGQVVGGLKKAGDFIVDKGLPIVEKVASGIATGLKYATPLIGAIAPEFLPIAMGAGALASTIGNAAGSARRVIGTAKQVVSAVPTLTNAITSGNAGKIISGIEKTASAASAVSGMPRISVPMINPAIAAMRRIA